MKLASTLLVLLMCILSLSINRTFGGEYSYIFVIEEGKPLYGYRVLETSKKNAFLGKMEAIKKWIILTNSKLYISKDQYLFPVIDSKIIDRTKGIVLFFINFSEKVERNFSLHDVKIDQDIKAIAIVKDKQRLLSIIEETSPPPIKENKITSSTAEDINLLALAKNYETMGQTQKAIEIYEEILKKDTFSFEIISKIASLYYKSGNFNKAKEYIQRLPKREDNLKKIIGISVAERKFEDALTLLNSEDLQDKGYLHYTKGIIFYLMNRRDEAYKELIELKKVDSKLADSLRDLLR